MKSRIAVIMQKSLLIVLLACSLGVAGPFEFAKQLQTTQALPGCFTDLVVSQNDRCEGMRETLNFGKYEYLENDVKFVETVSKVLNAVTGSKTYNYMAVLIATLSQDQRMLPALKHVAAVEGKAKLKFKYAQKAVERLSQGKCAGTATGIATGRVNDDKYREICSFEDQEFTRIRLTKAALKSNREAP